MGTKYIIVYETTVPRMQATKASLVQSMQEMLVDFSFQASTVVNAALQYNTGYTMDQKKKTIWILRFKRECMS